MLKVNLVGRLVRDPELKKTTGGTDVCELDVACKNGGKDANVNYITVETFGAVALNVAKYLAKGKKIAASGDLEIKIYDREDGGKGYDIHLTKSDVEFIDFKIDEVAKEEV